MTAVVSRERARTTGLTAAAGALMLAVAIVMMIVAAPGHGHVRAHLARSSAVRLELTDFYATGTLDESQPQPDVRDITGREPRTFAQWAQAHADAFRPS
jgi:hypothetical protein